MAYNSSVPQNLAPEKPLDRAVMIGGLLALAQFAFDHPRACPWLGALASLLARLEVGHG